MTRRTRLARRAMMAITLLTGAGLVACDGAGDGPSAQAGGAGQVDLAPNFGGTDVLTYEHTLEISESRTSAPGAPVTSLAQVVRIYTLQPVAQEPDGGALVELIVKRVAIGLRTPEGFTINLDTDRLPPGLEDPQARAVRQLAGLRVIVAIGADGAVREIRGLGEALAQIGTLPQGLGAFFAEDWFRAAAEGAYRAREDGASASVGDEWVVTKHSDFADAQEAAHTTFTSQLSNVRDDIATIEGSATLELDFDRVGMVDTSGSQIDDQLYEFSKRWDLSRGSLLEHTTIQKVQITLDYGGLEVKVDQSTASRLARLSPDGVPPALITPESDGTDVDPGASETENPGSGQ